MRYEYQQFRVPSSRTPEVIHDCSTFYCGYRSKSVDAGGYNCWVVYAFNDCNMRKKWKQKRNSVGLCNGSFVNRLCTSAVSCTAGVETRRWNCSMSDLRRRKSCTVLVFHRIAPFRFECVLKLRVRNDVRAHRVKNDFGWVGESILRASRRVTFGTRWKPVER